MRFKFLIIFILVYKNLFCYLILHGILLHNRLQKLRADDMTLNNWFGCKSIPSAVFERAYLRLLLHNFVTDIIFVEIRCLQVAFVQQNVSNKVVQPRNLVQTQFMFLGVFEASINPFLALFFKMFLHHLFDLLFESRELVKFLVLLGFLYLF